jgi:hypothetical protein
MITMNKSLIIAAVLIAAAILSGCDALDFSAPDKTYQGENLVKFTSSSASLTAFESVDPKTITFSHLKAQGSTVNYTISVDESASTAQEGVHFNLPSKTVSIAANEYIGSFEIELLQDQLLEEKTLILRFDEPNTVVSNESMTIVMAAFFEFDRANFLGEWVLEYEWFYGPGTSNYTAVEGSADNSIIVQGMLDGTDIEIFFDASDPANFVAEVPATPEVWQHSAGPVSVEGEGTFSTVTGSESIQLNLFHFIPNVGNFGAPSPLTLTRP